MRTTVSILNVYALSLKLHKNAICDPLAQSHFQNWQHIPQCTRHLPTLMDKCRSQIMLK